MISISVRLDIVFALLGMWCAFLTPEVVPLETAIAHETRPVVFVIGQSNAEGREGPVYGRSLPGNSVLIRNGERLFGFGAKTGIEEGLIHRLRDRGYPSPLVAVQATGGISLADWIRFDLPKLVALARERQLIPDAIALVHGETDGRTVASAERYQDAAFGDDPGSLLSLLRDEWPGVPLIVAELRVTDTRHGVGFEALRRSQRLGCEIATDCEIVETEGLELQRDQIHYTGRASYALGWDVGGRL